MNLSKCQNFPSHPILNAWFLHSFNKSICLLSFYKVNELIHSLLFTTELFLSLPLSLFQRIACNCKAVMMPPKINIDQRLLVT